MSAPVLKTNVDRSIKLPVGETFAAAWQEGRAGFGVYARLALVPLTVTLSVRLAQAVFEPEALLDPQDGLENAPGLAILLHFLSEVVVLLVLVPTFTAWHRYFVLGPAHPAARLRYEVGDEEWRYLNVGLRLGLLFLIPALIGQGLIEALGLRPGLSNLMLALTWLVLARWLLLFPASATGQLVEGRWRDWTARGNALRLWLVSGVPEVIFSLVDLGLLEWLGSEEPEVAAAVLYALVSVAVSFAASAFSVAGLAIAYRRLAPSAGAAAP